MTLDQFFSVMNERVPTSEEFANFIHAQGWKVGVKPDGSGYLQANRSGDELAIGVAKMLSRQPYRSRMVEYLQRIQTYGDKAPEEQQPGGAKPTTTDDQTTTCRVCRAWVDPSYAADVWEMCRKHATRGSKNVPPTMGCPYKPNSNDMDHSPYG